MDFAEAGGAFGPAPARSWFADQLSAIGRAWWLVATAAVAALVIALIYLRQADYLYTAELRVSPAPSTSGSRPTSALGGLAALTGLADTSEQVSPFRFYLHGLYSTEVAARLARDPALMHRLFAAEWDAQDQRWRQPPSLVGAARRGVAGLLGLPQFGWVPPDAARLQSYLVDNVSVRQSVRTPLVSISYDSPDPAFAVQLLGNLHATTDAFVREQQIARTRGNIAYLADKLRTVTLAEQRQALVTALAEQERQAMLANGRAAYAADPFDVPVASARPTRPRPLSVLAGALVVGLLLGTLAAAARGRRAGQRSAG